MNKLYTCDLCGAEMEIGYHDGEKVAYCGICEVEQPVIDQPVEAARRERERLLKLGQMELPMGEMSDG